MFRNSMLFKIKQYIYIYIYYIKTLSKNLQIIDRNKTAMFGVYSLSAVKVEIGSIGIKNKKMAFKDMYCN